MNRIFATAAICMVVGLGVDAAAQTPPPAAAFGRQPGVLDAAISPNGQSIALLGGTPETRTLSFATIDRPDLPTLNLGTVEAVGVRWVGDDYALARIAIWREVAPRVAYRFERNLSVDRQAKPIARLLKNEAVSEALISQPVIGVTDGPNPRVVVLGLQLVGEPEGNANTRFQRKGVDDPFLPALWSVDPATGKGVMIERGGFDTVGWEIDRSGEARIRLDVSASAGTYSLFGRPKGTRQWTPLITQQDRDRLDDYLGYSPQDDAIYMAVSKEGATQVTRKRLSDGATSAVGDPVRGSSVALVKDRATGAIVGLRAGEDAITWLDTDLGATSAALTRVFKGQQVELKGWSSDRSRIVVMTESETSPPAWFLFDRTRKELSPLGEAYPELKGVSLGPTRSLTYKARDGLEIPAYLTLPPADRPSRGKPPLIVLPHGGPAAHDDAGFDWLTQFLATRGYAVLRPQFRGSTGYGTEFEKAGRGEWGGKIQTDLLDGVASLAAAGEIDPTRVCIVGASFGGYAALAGASLHPEAYRCAASIAGISDLGALSNQMGRLYGVDAGPQQALRRLLAGMSVDQLRAISPLRQVDHIRAPILLVHGDQDTVVSPEQSQFMADALKAAGKPVQHVVLAGDDHYLMQSSTRTQMLEALGAFLAANLPVTP